jgi:hypothetical protein
VDHALYAINDFRTLCRLKRVTPTDNLSELTARAHEPASSADATVEDTSRVYVLSRRRPKYIVESRYWWDD